MGWEPIVPETDALLLASGLGFVVASRHGRDLARVAAAWDLWPPLQPCYDSDFHWRVKTLPATPKPVEIVLERAAFNWRLNIAVVGDYGPYGSYCFLGPHSLPNALRAAVEWADPDADPPGPWFRHVQTGRIQPEHDYR